ncbi:MAG: imidazolonepropionase-like amidohydrolase [Planctomycetota bacterium]|jgi:imidazolonepropionase-like amidohydrolase
MRDKPGIVEVGKLADLNVVPANPLDHVTILSKPMLAMKDSIVY